MVRHTSARPTTAPHLAALRCQRRHGSLCCSTTVISKSPGSLTRKGDNNNNKVSYGFQHPPRDSRSQRPHRASVGRRMSFKSVLSDGAASVPGYYNPDAERNGDRSVPASPLKGGADRSVPASPIQSACIRGISATPSTHAVLRSAAAWSSPARASRAAPAPEVSASAVQLQPRDAPAAGAVPAEESFTQRRARQTVEVRILRWPKSCCVSAVCSSTGPSARRTLSTQSITT